MKSTKPTPSRASKSAKKRARKQTRDVASFGFVNGHAIKIIAAEALPTSKLNAAEDAEGIPGQSFLDAVQSLDGDIEDGVGTLSKLRDNLWAHGDAPDLDLARLLVQELEDIELKLTNIRKGLWVPGFAPEELSSAHENFVFEISRYEALRTLWCPSNS